MSSSRSFTRLTDKSGIKTNPDDNYINSTTVYLLRPPKSHSSSRPWIITRELMKNHHPLTSKPHSFNFDRNLDFSQLNPTALTTFYAFKSHYPVDKLLVLPDPPDDVTRLHNYTFFALYGGGQLQGCSHGVKFDDIIGFEDKVYVVDRQGITKLVNYSKTIGKTIVSPPFTPGSGRFGWRKRFAVDGETLYLVVRTEEILFDVFRLKSRAKKRGKSSYFYWDRVERFKSNKVLFMARDCYFFLRASRKFPGREYKNCIVFSEAAFPQYGNVGWEFTETDDGPFSEDDIAVFRLDDERFVRKGEGENSGFPKIDWSPPDWVLNVSPFPADEFQTQSESKSSGLAEREPDEEEGLVFDSGDKNETGLKDSKNKVVDEQEVMECDFGSQDQDQGGLESESGSQDQGRLECDSVNQGKDGEEMQSKEANIEGGASLPKDPVTPSLSAIEEEVTRTLLRMNAAVVEETLGKNIAQTIPKASASLTIENHRRDSATTKFEGLDIRSDLVPTLQKIWHKHGNIMKDSIVRSGDIVARALESLATMVQILEDNAALSLGDSQADYLSSTLSDLRSIGFNVYWLVSFVEKALLVYKSKTLVESLNNLSQLSSQGEERRAILLDELAKLDKEQNKLKEEIANMSRIIPFSGEVKFDEPIGAGLS